MTPDAEEAIRRLWDALDKIHTAARDHRLNVAGARDASLMLAYAERTAAAALATVPRPADEQQAEE